MQTKITIDVDSDILDSARKHAETYGITIDQLINDLMKQ
jgi:antitoxin component of RelBE/YafQ-DinJ toxin-antitoxin module